MFVTRASSHLRHTSPTGSHTPIVCRRGSCSSTSTARVVHHFQLRCGWLCAAGDAVFCPTVERPRDRTGRV